MIAANDQKSTPDIAAEIMSRTNSPPNPPASGPLAPVVTDEAEYTPFESVGLDVFDVFQSTMPEPGWSCTATGS